MINRPLPNLPETGPHVAWLRPLDHAFVEFLKGEAPNTPRIVLFIAAIASRQLGEGHVCLDLEALLEDPERVFSTTSEKNGDPSMPDDCLALINNLTLTSLVRQLEASPLVSRGNGNTPLVLSNGMLYLRRYWDYTQSVAQDILKRLNHHFSIPRDLSQRIDGFFESLRSHGEKAKTEVHWQSVAAAVSAASSFTVISGGPGTGKTTTVVRLLALLQHLTLEKGHKLRIRMAAPTGKAAARLSASLDHEMAKLPQTLRDNLPKNVSTLHRLLGSRPDTRHFIHDAQNPLHVDLLVVDEASMIDLEIMAALLAAIPENARLILLGDKDQLASVEAGAVLGDICGPDGHLRYTPSQTAWIKQQTGYDLSAFLGHGTLLDQHVVLLRKNYRFGHKSGIAALSEAVNSGNTELVEDVWRMGFKDIHRISVENSDDASLARLILDGGGHSTKMGYRKYLERVGLGPQDGSEDLWLRQVMDDFAAFQLLTPLKSGTWGVKALNEGTAHILFRHGLIDQKEGWYPGRPVMVTRNDYEMGLMNGDTGIALPIKDSKSPGDITLKVVFPMADGSFRKVSPGRLGHIQTVYAMTVHKSQGSEFDHAALVLPDRLVPVLTRELLYTAITRSRRRFTLVTANDGLFNAAVRRRTYRASGLAGLLRPSP